MCCPVQLNAALFYVSKPSPSKLDLSHPGQEDYPHKSITPVAENFWFLISSFFLPSLFSGWWTAHTQYTLDFSFFMLLPLVCEDMLKLALNCLLEAYPRGEWDLTGRKISLYLMNLFSAICSIYGVSVAALLRMHSPCIWELGWDKNKAEWRGDKHIALHPHSWRLKSSFWKEQKRRNPF